jgi:hypothetical protein
VVVLQAQIFFQVTIQYQVNLGGQELVPIPVIPEYRQFFFIIDHARLPEGTGNSTVGSFLIEAGTFVLRSESKLRIQCEREFPFA